MAPASTPPPGLSQSACTAVVLTPAWLRMVYWPRAPATPRRSWRDSKARRLKALGAALSNAQFETILEYWRRPPWPGLPSARQWAPDCRPGLNARLSGLQCCPLPGVWTSYEVCFDPTSTVQYILLPHLPPLTLVCCCIGS